MNIITPSEVVEYAFTLREEISPASIRPTKIDVAAERFVRPRFGDDLYEKFVQGDYEPFVDQYLKPAVAHYVRYVVVDELSIQLTDNGAVLFQSEDLRSMQTKQTSAISSEQSTQTDSDTSEIRQSVSARKDHKESSNTDASGVVSKDHSTNEDVRTVGEKSDSDTVRKDYNTKTDVEKSAMTDSTRESTDVTTSEDVKNRDYESSETPKTVGTALMGSSHEKTDTEKRSNDSQVNAGTSSEEGTTKIDHLYNENSVTSGKSELSTDKHAALIAKDESSQKTTLTRSGEDVTDQNSTNDRVAETQKEGTRTGERKSSDDATAQTDRRQMRPANDFQRRIIRARALADANILMSKAVRYVERNAELFPEYEPMPRSFGRIVL